MNYEERTVVRMAINDAKRNWLEQQGGYRKVEDSAAGHDLILSRAAQGQLTKAELQARNRELERQLKRARNTISDIRRSRDMWRKRAEKRGKK